MALGGIDFDKATGYSQTVVNESGDREFLITPNKEDDKVMDIDVDLNGKTQTILDDPEYVSILNREIEETLNDPDVMKAMYEHLASGKSFESFWTEMDENATSCPQRLKDFWQKLADLKANDGMETITDTKNALKELELQLTHYGQNVIAEGMRIEATKSDFEDGDGRKQKYLKRSYMMDHHQDAKHSVRTDAYYAGAVGSKNNQIFDDDATRSGGEKVDRGSLGLDVNIIQELEKEKEKKKQSLAEEIFTFLSQINSKKSDLQQLSNFLNGSENYGAISQLFVGGDNFGGDNSNLIKEGKFPITYIDSKGNVNVVSIRDFMMLYVQKYWSLITTNDFSSKKDSIQQQIKETITNMDFDCESNTYFISRIYLDDCMCSGGDLFGNAFVDEDMPEDMIDPYDVESLFALNKTSNAKDTYNNKKALRKIIAGDDIDIQGVGKSKRDLKLLDRFKKDVKMLCTGSKEDSRGKFGEIMDTLFKVYDQWKGKIDNSTEDPSTKDFWINYNTIYKEKNGIFGSKGSDAKYMADLYTMYKEYRDGKGNIQNAPYMTKVRDMVHNYITNHAQGSDGNVFDLLGFDLSSMYNENNDAVGNVMGMDDEGSIGKLFDLFSDQGDESKAKCRSLIRKYKKGDINLDKIISRRNYEIFVYNDTQLNKDEKEFRDYWVSKVGKSERGPFYQIVQGLRYGYDIDTLYRRAYILNQNSSIQIHPAYLAMYHIADINVDGKIMADDQGMKSGQQMMKLFRLSAIEVGREKGLDMSNNANLAAAYDTVICNILTYVQSIATKMGDFDLANKVGAIISKDGKNVLEEFKNNPWLVAACTNILANSQVPLQYIMRYGNNPSTEENEAIAKRKEEMDVSLELTTGLSKEDLQKINKKIDEKIQELIRRGDTGLENLSQEKIKDLKDHLRIGIASMVRDMVGDVGKGVGGGVSVGNIDTILGSLSFDFGLGVGKNVFGFYVGAGLQQNFEKGGYTNEGIGLVNGFIPVASLAVGKRRGLKDGKTLSLSANVGIVGSIPSWGVSMTYNLDKADKINKEIDKLNIDGIVSGLQNLKEGDMVTAKKDIIQVLKTKAPKLDYTLLDKAATNLYQGYIVYKQIMNQNASQTFMVTSFADFVKSQISQALVEGLVDEGIEITGVGLGVQFLASWFPMPIAMISWAKYKGYTEYLKSDYKILDQAKLMGYGNRLVTDAVTDANINSINKYINDILNSSRAASLGNNNGSRNEVKTNSYVYERMPNIEIVEEQNQKCIKIPLNLARGGKVNIYIDDSLKGYMKIEKISQNDYIVLPAAIPMRISNTSGRNSIMSLHFGSTYADVTGPDQDLLIQRGRDTIQTNPQILARLGEPSKYEAKNGAGINTKNVTEAINSLKQKLRSDNIQSSPYDNVNVHMSATSIDLGGLPKLNSVSNPLVYKDGVLKMPKYGTLTIVKDANGSYRAEYLPTPTKTIIYSYRIEKVGMNKTYTIKENDEFFSLNNSRYAADKQLFTNKEAALKTKDVGGRNQEAFQTFLENARINPADDNSLLAMTKSVLELIGNDSSLSDISNKIKQFVQINNNQVTSLKEKINEEKKQELSYLLTMLKVYIVINDQYENTDIDTLINRRTAAFDILWNTKERSYTNIKSEIDKFRGEFANNNKGKKKESKNFGTEYKNIIGYTAFYGRGGGVDKNCNGFSITPPGSTRVLCDIKEFTNQGEAKTWFTNKLKQNTFEATMIKDAITGQKNFPAPYVSLVNNMSIDELCDFIKLGTFTKNGKTLKMKASVVFYLLGECGNESIGLQIEEITTEGGDYEVGTYVKPDKTGMIIVNTTETGTATTYATQDGGGSLGVAAGASDVQSGSGADGGSGAT